MTMEPAVKVRPSVITRLTSRTVFTVREAKQIFKEQGFKGVIRRYGWKFFAVFFTYYLVRDVTLYIILPLYLFKQL